MSSSSLLASLPAFRTTLLILLEMHEKKLVWVRIKKLLSPKCLLAAFNLILSHDRHTYPVIWTPEIKSCSYFINIILAFSFWLSYEPVYYCRCEKKDFIYFFCGYVAYVKICCLELFYCMNALYLGSIPANHVTALKPYLKLQTRKNVCDVIDIFYILIYTFFFYVFLSFKILYTCLKVTVIFSFNV